MQIILKKKNASTTDRTFYIDEGSTITENYNETLDSADIRISHITSQLDIEPFDKVILRDENGLLNDRYMCVDSYTETMESLDPYIYSYQISLFSETKELEGILLPNLSITKGDNNRTVWYYLQQYLNLYNAKIRISGQTTLSNKYSWLNSYASYQKFDVTCPELQWNNPTLREVLTDLMMVCDCIPVVKNNKIDFIDLTKKKDAIDATKINYIQRSQSSEDYVSELKMDMLNVMQTSVDGVKQTVSRMEYQTFKASDGGYVVTTDNMIIRTQYPILNVKHLWMVFQGGCGESTFDEQYPATFMYKVDLCDMELISGTYKQILYEYSQYSVLPLKLQTPSNLNVIYQNIALYYKREDNVISGFSTTSKKGWGVFSDKDYQLYVLKKLIMENCYSISGNYGTLEFNPGQRSEQSWYSTFFIIEYETLADAVFKAGKEKAPTHERAVVDNQINAYVDAYNQGFMEYQKVNRLGNHQLYINARYESNSFTIQYSPGIIPITCKRDVNGDITDNGILYLCWENIYNAQTKRYTIGKPTVGAALYKLEEGSLISSNTIEAVNDNMLKIGDYYNESIVYQTTYQIYKNHIEVNAVATKDYILRDYFTGVKARVRSWKIADATQSLTRHDLNKYYLEFSKRRKSEYVSFDNEFSQNNHFTEYFLTPLVSGYIQPLRYCFIKTFTNDETEYGYYALDLLGRIIGNSIVFTFGFDDNFAVGKKLASNTTTNDLEISSIGWVQNILEFKPFRIKNSYTSNYGGVPLEDVKYVDDTGEFENIQYCLTNNVDDPDFPQDVHDYDDDYTQRDWMLRVCQLPEVDETIFSSYIKHFNIKEVYKDNREMPKISTQFEFCSDTHDIVFTKRFLELQECIRDGEQGLAVTNTIRIYQDENGDRFDWKNPSLTNAVLKPSAGLAFQHYEKSSAIYITGLSNVSTSAIYIADAYGNILLGVKGISIFYLNVLLSRDYNIYDINGNVVGSI